MTTPEGSPQPEGGILPDTPVAPLTLERIGEVFEMANLQYRIERHDAGDGTSVEIFRSGFSNAAIFMQMVDDVLIVDSIWRGELHKSDGPTVLNVTNQWNREWPAPTLRFMEAGAEGLRVSAVREINIAEGLSQNQLGSFLHNTIDSILQSFAYLEEKFPHLVTWQEHNHD